MIFFCNLARTSRFGSTTDHQTVIRSSAHPLITWITIAERGQSPRLRLPRAEKPNPLIVERFNLADAEKNGKVGLEFEKRL
jgi:hypothetical protein